LIYKEENYTYTLLLVKFQGKKEKWDRRKEEIDVHPNE
jgi:hypothetical protein